MKKRGLITVLIILAVIIGGLVIRNSADPDVPEKIAKCIGENSILYTQYGCSHCIDQENLFGENVKYLNIIDCFYELDKCEGMTATPTWIINSEKYVGVQSIEKLQELTNC